MGRVVNPPNFGERAQLAPVTNRRMEFLHFCESSQVVDTLIWWGRRFRLPTLTNGRLPKETTAFPSRRCMAVPDLAAWGTLPANGNADAYPTPGHALVAGDRVLDRRASGPLWLRDPRIADLVSDTILIGDCERRFYRVHLPIRPLAPVPVPMRGLKESTARNANRILGRTGQPFWQDESFDRADHRLYRKQPGFCQIGVLPGRLALVQRGLAGETACPTNGQQCTGLKCRNSRGGLVTRRGLAKPACRLFRLIAAMLLWGRLAACERLVIALFTAQADYQSAADC